MNTKNIFMAFFIVSLLFFLCGCINNNPENNNNSTSNNNLNGSNWLDSYVPVHGIGTGTDDFWIGFKKYLLILG